MMDLNPAAVEAAAKVMHGACSIPGCNEWQGIYLDRARLALTAAAPLIVRATADAIADKIKQEMPESGTHINMSQYREGLIDGMNRVLIQIRCSFPDSQTETTTGDDTCHHTVAEGCKGHGDF